MTNKVQINVNTFFTDYIDAYSNGEDLSAEVLNRAIIQIALNTGWLKEELNNKEPAFEKRSAFNKNFGTTPDTVAKGDDHRFFDARTPLEHKHDITDITVENGQKGFFYFDGETIQLQNSSVVISWDTISNIPTYFRSSVDMIDGLVDIFQSRASSDHKHNIQDIDGLEDVLFRVIQGTAIPSHVHRIEDVVSLRETLDAKAPVDHVHQIEDIEGLEELVSSQTSRINILKQSFVYAGDAVLLNDLGDIFSVTLNGVDLADGEWQEDSGTLSIEGLTDGDTINVYSQESAKPTITRQEFLSKEGDNNFTVGSGVTVWQVTVNGIDINEYVQSGTRVTIEELNSGDTVIIYGITGE